MSLEWRARRARGGRCVAFGRAGQGGALLVELMLVVGLTVLLAVWGGHEWVERVRRLQVRSLAVWMREAQAAVQAYLDQRVSPPGAAVDETGEAADPGELPPSWDALQADGFLAPGWRPRGPLSQTLGLRFEREGACPESPCIVRAFIHTRAGLHGKSGHPDEALLAEWLLAARGEGLVLWPRHSGVFSGAGRRFPVPDTPHEGALPAGAVALLAQKILPADAGRGDAGGPGGETGNTEDFLRLRDARDPDFQNRLSVVGDVRTGARVVAYDSLVLEKPWQVRSSCSTEGALGRAEGAGVVICRQGTWQVLARPPGGGFLQNSRRGCVNVLGQSSANPMTGACSCPPGHGALLVSEGGSAMAPEGLSLGYVCVPQ